MVIWHGSVIFYKHSLLMLTLYSVDTAMWNKNASTQINAQKCNS